MTPLADADRIELVKTLDAIRMFVAAAKRALEAGHDIQADIDVTNALQLLSTVNQKLIDRDARPFGDLSIVSPSDPCT